MQLGKHYPDVFMLVPAYSAEYIVVRGVNRDRHLTRTVYQWVNDGNDADHHDYVARVGGDLIELTYEDGIWYEDGWIPRPTIKISR